MLMNLRVFLSSPSDVADERNLARQVLQNLPKEHAFRGKVHIEEVSWDDPGAPVPLAAHLTPQEAINQERPKPSECDVVVVILWSRMGTPLPDEFRKPDGSAYRSGTEWEFVDAIESAEKAGKPIVWVYKRNEEIKIVARDLQREEKLRQADTVEAFFSEFHSKGGGSLQRSYLAYDSPNEFARLLEQHLRDQIAKRLEEVKLPLAQAETAALFESDPKSMKEPLWQGNPYRGLDPFGPEHTAIFFGRGLETDELVKRVRDDVRVLAVIGASGSGKSSLVAAGLLPRLAAGAVDGGAQWVQVRFTPAEQGDNSFRALAMALFSRLHGTKLSVDAMADRLSLEPAYIEEVARQALNGKPLPPSFYCSPISSRSCSRPGWPKRIAHLS